MHIFSVVSMTTTGVLSTSSHGDIGHAEAQYNRVMREGVYSFVAIFDGGEMLAHYHPKTSKPSHQTDLDRDGRPKQCNKSLMNLGLPRPRTCALCGLGPCHYSAPTSTGRKYLDEIKDIEAEGQRAVLRDENNQK